MTSETIVTHGSGDPGRVTLLDATHIVDRERVLILAAPPSTRPILCELCPRALGDLAPAVVRLRYTDLRLRRRVRHIGLCWGCWPLEITRVLGEPVDDVRVLVPRGEFTPTAARNRGDAA